MKAKTCWEIAVGGFAGVVFTAGLLGWAQYGAPGGGVQVQNPVGVSPRQQSGLSPGIEVDPGFAQKHMRALNADRQKSMVSDADKLLRVARQLDAEVASNPTDQLTPDEMQKVAEIEKLARSVKTKMSQSFSGGPQFHPSFVPIGVPGVE